MPGKKAHFIEFSTVTNTTSPANWPSPEELIQWAHGMTEATKKVAAEAKAVTEAVGKVPASVKSKDMNPWTAAKRVREISRYMWDFVMQGPATDAHVRRVHTNVSLQHLEAALGARTRVGERRKRLAVFKTALKAERADKVPEGLIKELHQVAQHLQTTRLPNTDAENALQAVAAIARSATMRGLAEGDTQSAKALRAISQVVSMEILNWSDVPEFNELLAQEELGEHKEV